MHVSMAPNTSVVEASESDTNQELWYPSAKAADADPASQTTTRQSIHLFCSQSSPCRKTSGGCGLFMLQPRGHGGHGGQDRKGCVPLLSHGAARGVARVPARHNYQDGNRTRPNFIAHFYVEKRTRGVRFKSHFKCMNG